MKLGTTVALVVVFVAHSGWRSPSKTSLNVAYPDGYRSWTHVQTTFIGPEHPRFDAIGGFQHSYANDQAMEGYRTRAFPEGSIVVVDWLELRDNGPAFGEGDRRQLDMMVKDSVRFAATGGWGFQRFVKDSKTEHAAAPTAQQCFSCHMKLRKDELVLGRYRQ
jgi:hypothetical protein